MAENNSQRHRKKTAITYVQHFCILAIYFPTESSARVKGLILIVCKCQQLFRQKAIPGMRHQNM